MMTSVLLMLLPMASRLDESDDGRRWCIDHDGHRWRVLTDASVGFTERGRPPTAAEKYSTRHAGYLGQAASKRLAKGEDPFGAVGSSASRGVPPEHSRRPVEPRLYKPTS